MKTTCILCNGYLIKEIKEGVINYCCDFCKSNVTAGDIIWSTAYCIIIYPLLNIVSYYIYFNSLDIWIEIHNNSLRLFKDPYKYSVSDFTVKVKIDMDSINKEQLEKKIKTILVFQ